MPDNTKKEECGICTQNIDEEIRCSLHIDDIHCPIHPTSEPFNKFNGRCKWCYSQMHPEYSSPQPELSEEYLAKDLLGCMAGTTEEYRLKILRNFIHEQRIQAQRELAEEIKKIMDNTYGWDECVIAVENFLEKSGLLSNNKE